VAGGNSLGYLLMHPSGQYLYSNESGAARVVRTYRVGPGGTLTLIDTEPTGAPSPLELAITRDGSRVYSAGGTSDGGNKVTGLNVDPGGTLTLMPASPFVSPGVSPSNVFADELGKFLLVGHGTDATVRSFEINPLNGNLTSTGFSFDVGFQGTLGDVASRVGLMFVTDNSTAIDGLMGVYSFTLEDDGSFTQNGPIVSTQGIAPRSMAIWIPRLKGDMDCNGLVSLPDIPLFIQALVDPAGYLTAQPGCDLSQADMNKSGTVDGDDIQLYINVFPGF
jgi:hypothetical protein